MYPMRMIIFSDDSSDLLTEDITKIEGDTPDTLKNHYYTQISKEIGLQKRGRFCCWRTSYWQ